LDWITLGEIIKVVGAVATACAAWFAVSIAYRGLEKWRSETLGKRRADVATAALATIYEAQDILGTRDPLGSFPMKWRGGRAFQTILRKTLTSHRGPLVEALGVLREAEVAEA
jgi:hypothetical protein